MCDISCQGGGLAREWTIGRAPSCQVIVDDARVSRWHARLVQEGDALLIEDLGSGSGTFVNGKPVTGRTPVRTGDVIRLGSIPLDTRTGLLGELLRSASHGRSGGGQRVARPGLPWLLGGISVALAAAIVVVVLAASGGRQELVPADVQAGRPSPPAGKAAGPGSDEPLPAWAFEAVFMVAVEVGTETVPVGTGFVPGSERFVVTNAHVAEGIEEHCVRRGLCRGVVIGNERPGLRLGVTRVVAHPAATAGIDEYKPDLAVLFVDDPGRLPRGIPLARDVDVDNRTLRGRRAAIIGFPGLTMNPAAPNATVDWGTVGRVVNGDWIQFSAMSSPGSSGSPVIVQGPEVIGVNYAGLGIRPVVTVGPDGSPGIERIQQGDGLNLAVGVRLLRTFLASVR